MPQPFQFDVFGAPPADISPGIAAYSQGMTNAANLAVQQGVMFRALREVAQDYMRFRQQQNLQARELEAQEASQRAIFSNQRALHDEEMGFQRDVELRRARQADQEAMRAERALDQTDKRLALESEGARREAERDAWSRGMQEYALMEKQRRELGMQALMQAAAEQEAMNAAGGMQGPGQPDPLMRDVGVPGPLGLSTQQLDPMALMSLGDQINQPPTTGPGGMGPPTAGGPMVGMEELAAMAELLQAGQPTQQGLLNAQAPWVYAQQGADSQDAKALAEQAELDSYRRNAETDYPLTWDTLKPFHSLLGPSFESALGAAHGGEGGYTIRLQDGMPMIGGGGEIERRALQNKLDELGLRDDLDLNWDALAGGIATRGQVAPEKSRAIGGKLRASRTQESRGDLEGRLRAQRRQSDPDRLAPPQAKQLERASRSQGGVHPDGTPSGEQSGHSMVVPPQQRQGAAPQRAPVERPPEVPRYRSPLEESAERYFMGGATPPAAPPAPRAAQGAAPRAERSEAQAQARRTVRELEQREDAARRSGDNAARAAALRELSVARKRLEELLRGGRER